MRTQEYVSRIREVVKVKDGDTYEFYIDPGYRTKILVEIRLMGFDTPEKTKGTAREKALAKVAQELADTFLWLDRPGTKFWVRSEKDPNGGFGRWLGDVWLEREDGSELHLGDWLRQHQLASVWPTRWRDEFDS